MLATYRRSHTTTVHLGECVYYSIKGRAGKAELHPQYVGKFGDTRGLNWLSHASF